MDQLSPAIRLFRQTLPKSKPLVDAVTLRKLRVWLSDDVGKLVDELSRRPAFREYSAWVIHSLQNGSASEERQVVDSLEAALSDVAMAYVKLLGNERIRTRLQTLFPPRPHVTSESVEIAGNGAPRVLKRETGLIDESALEMSQLQHFRSRGSKEYALVNVHDYFEPRQKFVRSEDGRPIQFATAIVSVTPELHPVGNFVLQTANRRLKELLELLTTIRRKVTVSIRDLGISYKGQANAEAAWDRLQNQLAIYHRTFQSGRENDLRNACMVLTQIYAAFHPAPDLDWLGLPKLLSQEGAMVLQQRIRGFRGGELFERVNGALIDVRRLYEDRDPKLSAREEAIARGDLVLVTESRELYWNGKLTSFNVANLGKSWELLFPLVKKAKNGGHVTEQDVFGDKVTGRAGMPMRMQRLKKQLPGGLRKLIKPGPDPRTYRLTVEPQRIYIV